MAQRAYLCFLNSDTVVTPFSWAGMVKALQDDHGVGVVGPSTSERAHAKLSAARNTAIYIGLTGRSMSLLSDIQPDSKRLPPWTWNMLGGLPLS